MEYRGVPESDVKVVVPRRPSIEIVEAVEEFANNGAEARTEVIGRAWRTRFTLAAIAERSAPCQEQKRGRDFSHELKS